jgi:hypothetical protein
MSESVAGPVVGTQDARSSLDLDGAAGAPRPTDVLT